MFSSFAISTIIRKEASFDPIRLDYSNPSVFTRPIEMICVLEIIDGPARGKRIWIKENQCVEIGRVSTADFSIPSDSHMSRRHLLLETTQNGFRIRDLGSANGTFLNNSRITVQNVTSGDRVRAGMTVFTVSIREDGENPHAEDGVTFGRNTPNNDSVPESGGSIEAPEHHGTIRSLEGLEPLEFESTVKIPIGSLPENDNESTLPIWRTNETKFWWKSYFTPTEVSGVYEQSNLYVSPVGNLMGLMQEFESEFQLAIIVNVSQLDSNSRQILAGLQSAGLLKFLTKSLCSVRFGTSRDFQNIVEMVVGQDAIICVGERKKNGQLDWGQFANSLSFPSMFRSHLTDPGSSLRKSLLTYRALAIFELDREGKLGLLLGD